MTFTLDQSIGYLLNRTNVRMKNNLLQYLKEHNITPEQWASLNRLWVTEGISPKEIAQLISKDEPTTVRIIAKIEKKGFITKQPNPQDHRSYLVFLTPKGRNLKDILQPLGSQALNKALAGIDTKQLETTMEVLNKIYNNLESQSTERN